MKRLSVVISQSNSQNPAKRELEEELVAALLFENGIDVTVIPHLYDLKAEGTGLLALQGMPGDIVVLAWLFPRAARWTLDRQGIRGNEGVSLLVEANDDEDDDEPAEPEQDDKVRVAASRPHVNRKIYCIDLRAANQPAAFVDEIKRIYREINTQVVGIGPALGSWLQGSPQPEQLARYEQPTNRVASEHDRLGQWTPAADASANSSAAELLPAQLQRIDEETGRRWYPVIDYSRCTNCLECIDFCLFGVYGVDRVETILVEQPDNCRKGCPACSRVCPENAIIFPQHKTPGIAGAPEGAGSLKIDLSQLFGAPSNGDAIALAARERDEQLLIAGRAAVGLSVGIPKRHSEPANAPKDDLDKLIDQLDELDL